MPIDLSAINLNWVAWIFIALAVIVLAFAVIRLFGHLVHFILHGCGLILLVAALLYILHLLKII